MTGRPSDQIKEIRSYTVHFKAGLGWFIKSSHWQPGYSPAHKATEAEALDYAVEAAEHEMIEAQAKVVALHTLRAEIMAGAS